MTAKAEIKYGSGRLTSPVLENSWGFISQRVFGLAGPANGLIALKGFGEADDTTRVCRAIEAFDNIGVFGLLAGFDLPPRNKRRLVLAANYLLLTDDEWEGAKREIGEQELNDQPSVNPPDELKLFSPTIAELENLESSGAPERYLQAAQEVAGGRFPAEIVSDLQRVRYLPDGSAEIPDWLSLAAWSLDYALHSGRPREVKPCKWCGLPWLAAETARYCHRMAPGSWKQTCLDLGKARDYRARKEGQ